MEDKKQQGQQAKADEKNIINTDKAGDAASLKKSPTSSQNSASTGQVSGGAVQPIQSGNQSREAEQDDLR